MAGPKFTDPREANQYYMLDGRSARALAMAVEIFGSSDYLKMDAALVTTRIQEVEAKQAALEERIHRMHVIQNDLRYLRSQIRGIQSAALEHEAADKVKTQKSEALAQARATKAGLKVDVVKDPARARLLMLADLYIEQGWLTQAKLDSWATAPNDELKSSLDAVKAKHVARRGA